MVMMYFILTVQCLIVKQQNVIKISYKINQKFVKKINLKRFDQNSLLLNWSHNLSNYKKFMRICAEIKEYNCFWSPILTCLILGILTDICYLLFVCMFIDETSFIEKIALYPISINSLILIFFLTGHCAKLVNNNLKILHQNKLICLNISKINYFSFSVLLKVCF